MPLVVYFDEVGNPTLDDSDRDFPVFALAFFICESQCYLDEVIPRVQRLKFDWWGHEGVILHSRDIRKQIGDFGFLTDRTRRDTFYAALNEVMTACNYSIIGVAIRKDRHVAQYAYPADPYDLALLFAMERLVSVLEWHDQRQVVIVGERRGENEDRQLAVAFQRIVTRGSGFVGVERFQRLDFTLRFLPKSFNIIGTQMADLCAYPLARKALSAEKPNPAYEIVRQKLCRQFKIFP
jgi:hypothetical protein